MTEGTTTTQSASPMGWFYKISKAGDGYNIYRCVLGQSWERAEIHDVGEMSAEELRFLADLIAGHAAAVRIADDRSLPS